MPKLPITELRAFHKNPRRGDVATIVESLDRLGQYRPIVVNLGTKTGRPNEVLAGNHTVQAAKKLGWKEIDAHIVDVDDDTAARIVLVDNKSNDNATYDHADLLELVKTVTDLEATGWTPAEISDIADELADDVPDETAGEFDDAPPAPEKPVTEPGDIWLLGPHRLICGDATDPDVIAQLIGDDPADCLSPDPPYGVEYVGKTKDALTIENDGAAGLPALLRDAFTAAATGIRPGAPVYVAHADTERLTFETALAVSGFQVRQNLIWVKNTMVMGRSDYHYQHEPILTAESPTGDTDTDEGEAAEGDEVKTHTPVLYGFKNGGAGRLGRGGPRWYGDNRGTTVIEVPKPPANRDHPTMKPVDLILPMLRRSVKRGGVVLDPFGGSGSTLIAADIRKARARIVELDPRYCDVIARRWQQLAGKLPIRDGRGEHDFNPDN